MVFTGSLMDGLRTPDGPFADLVQWCGLPELTDNEHDKLWGATSDISIIQNCAYADWEDTGEDDTKPMQSDSYFNITTTNIEKLKEEVRQQIQDLLK